MARSTEIERLTTRVSRLCRSVSPPRLDINVWGEGVDGQEPRLLYTTAPDGNPGKQVLDVVIEAKKEGALS